MDDDEDRHDIFFQMMSDHDVHIDYAWSADEAFQLMSETKYDLACLDHDLSVEDQMCDPYGETREKNGTYLANRIKEELPLDRRPEMTILHSYNPAGREEMQRIFMDIGMKSMQRPFGR